MAGISESQEHRLGGLLARVAILESERVRDAENTNRRLDAIEDTLLEIQKTLAAAGGSWRALVAIGMLISAVSGAVGAFLAHK